MRVVLDDYPIEDSRWNPLNGERLGKSFCNDVNADESEVLANVGTLV